MTRDQFAALLLEIQEKERAVREAGQAEYSHDADNCFANFDSDADHGVSRLQSIATHLNKHMRGIKAFVNGHRSQREDIRGRIKDARLYLALLWAAVEDEEKQAKKEVQSFLEERDPRSIIVRSHEHEPHPDGWEYGADPLDELSRRRDMPEPLQGPRYSDIVSAPAHGTASGIPFLLSVLER